MQVEVVVPPDGQACELVEQGGGPLDDVARLAWSLDFLGAAAGDDWNDAPRASSQRSWLLSYPLSASRASGRRRGRPGRPATGAIPSTGSKAVLASWTSPPVVITFNGVPPPSQIR